MDALSTSPISRLPLNLSIDSGVAGKRVGLGSTPPTTPGWPARPQALPLLPDCSTPTTISRPRPRPHSLTHPSLPSAPPSSRRQYHRPGLLRVCVSEEQSRAEHSVVSSDCPVQSSARALTYIYLPCRPAAPPAAGAFLFAQLPRLRRFPPRANHASHTLDTLPGSSTGQELIASL